MDKPLKLFPATAYYITIVAFLFAGAVLAGFGNLNRSIYLFINSQSAQLFPDLFPVYITVLGESMILTVWAGLFMVLHPAHAKRILYSIIITSLVINILKRLIDLPRPPAVLSIDNFHLLGPVLNHFSFPSGHTAAAFTFAGIIMLSCSRFASISALLFAVLVGWSRIAVGVHWPADVFTGAAIALGVVMIVFKCSQKEFSKFGNCLTGFLLAVIALAGNLFSSEGFDYFAGVTFIHYLHATVAGLTAVYFIHKFWKYKYAGV